MQTEISLTIMFLLLASFVLFLWRTNLRTYKTVSAGGADSKFPSEIKLLTDVYKTDAISRSGTIVNLGNYDAYVVIGNSMKISRIEDRDFVFVEKLSEESKSCLEKDSVLLFEIDGNKDFATDGKKTDGTIEFKLRKFVAYINSSDCFETWFNEYIHVQNDREFVQNKYGQSVEKYRQNNPDADNFKLILSSTLDVKNNRLTYSFHPMKFLNGVVKYALKN